jgi:hypothetical protein
MLRSWYKLVLFLECFGEMNFTRKTIFTTKNKITTTHRKMSITSSNINSASMTDRYSFSISSAAVESWTCKGGLFIFNIRVKSSSEWILEKTLSNFEELRGILISANNDIAKYPFPKTRCRHLLLSTEAAMEKKRRKLDSFFD